MLQRTWMQYVSVQCVTCLTDRYFSIIFQNIGLLHVAVMLYAHVPTIFYGYMYPAYVFVYSCTYSCAWEYSAC